MASGIENTYWRSENGMKITLKEILSICKKKKIYLQKINLEWIYKNIELVKVSDKERIENVNLNYPIVILKMNEKEKVLDGNHRLAKAKLYNMKYIFAYIIKISDIPSEKQKIFL